MNRVYGVVGIRSVMSNWNADFTGYPKSLSNGNIFGSDKALKYPIKKYWEELGEKVLYIKSFKLDESKGTINLQPRSLKERYELLYDVADLKNEKDKKILLTNLFDAIDIKNFGATFTAEKNNVSITGAVQFGQGFNKYNDCEVGEQDILSPFRNSKKDDADNSSLGKKIFTDEAHYFYPFSINPNAYNNYIDLEVTEGYSDDDYKKFKEACLRGVTSYATNSKPNCENEFALFVEADSTVYLPNLASYITFEKNENNIGIVKLNLNDILNKDGIKSIEIYYNSKDLELDYDFNAKTFDIFTEKEI